MKKVTLIIKGTTLNKGDMLTISKKPHPKDENAIVVFDLDGKELGYLANSANTVAEGSVGATMLKHDFADSIKVTVGDFIENRQGVFNYYFAELIKSEVKDELSFSLAGGTTTYPGKAALVKAAKEGPVEVVLRIEGDKIVGLYEGVLAGAVKSDDETYEILQQYVEDKPSVSVTTTGIDRGQILCELKLNKGVQIVTKRTKIDDSIKRIISEGIDTEENLNEKLEYLKRYKATDIAIASLLESYIKYPEAIVNRIPEKPEVTYVDSSGVVRKSIAFLNTGANLRFEGEKGVGKNVLTETLCWLYNRPLFEFSSNSQHSNNSLLGGKTFEDAEGVSDEEKKATVWSLLGLGKLFKKVLFKGEKAEVGEDEITLATKAVMKFIGSQDKKLVFEMSSIIEAFMYGGIIVLDEFNASLAHVMLLFNSALDDRRRIEITGYGKIDGHKNFAAISTMNKNYEGTFEGNAATADRFVPILFPTLTTITPILQEKVKTINYETAVQANKLYLGLRDAVVAGQLSMQVLTIRGFIKACEVLEQGLTLKEALLVSVVDAVDDEDERNEVKEMVELMLG